jgi:predicted neuraminidase
MHASAFLLASLVSAFTVHAAESPAILKSEFIYESAPFPQCHASTIVETKDGLVTAWFGGTRERHPDVGIWSARQEGGPWTVPAELANGVQADGSRHPCWNPVLFQPKTGPLLLFYKIGPSPSEWWGMLMSSEDGGKTWSKPERLPNEILGPIKNKPLQLGSGDILCPTSTEHDGWLVHFDRTSDGGKTWTATTTLNDGKEIGAIQPSILQHKDGRLQAIGRTRQDRIFTLESTDEGRTWGRMTLLDLPNPNAGIDAVTLADWRFLLVYNHTTRMTGGRDTLNVAVSDDGRKWNAALVLEHEPGNEFSYPAVIQTRDGLVHITYTWHRTRVRHVVLDPTKLTLRPIENGEWPK